MPIIRLLEQRRLDATIAGFPLLQAESSQRNYINQFFCHAVYIKIWCISLDTAANEPSKKMDSCSKHESSERLAAVYRHIDEPEIKS